MLSSLLNNPAVQNTLASTCQNVITPWCKDAVGNYCQNKISEHTVNFTALLISVLVFVTIITIISFLEYSRYITEQTGLILFVIDIIIMIALYFILK